MAIDIGHGAVTGALHAVLTNYTYVILDNPANADGTLTSFEFYFYGNATNVNCGTFYGNTITMNSRDYETFASITGGSKQTFTGKNCTAVTGDYWGIHSTDGDCYYNTSGGVGWYTKAGDNFGSSTNTWSSSPAGYWISGYASDVSGGLTNVKTVNGLAIASVKTVMGLAIASVKSINSLT